jgi:hypothetical protein
MSLQVSLPPRLEELVAAVELSGQSPFQEKGETVLLQYAQSSGFTEIRKEIARMVCQEVTATVRITKMIRSQLFKKKCLGQRLRRQT